MKNTIKILSTFGLLGASITTSSTTLNNSKIEKFEDSSNKTGEIANVKVKPVNNFDAEYTGTLFDYSEDGYNSFAEYANDNQFFSDPFYKLYGKIGTGNLWQDTSELFTYNINSKDVEKWAVSKQSKEVMDIYWKSKDKVRTTYLEVYESIIDDTKDKTLDFKIHLYIENQNRLYNVKFQAYC